tara:strand:+ start:426 stop:1250 length:825 start_codon:yes stop_codon:yes gene_type:complete
MRGGFVNISDTLDSIRKGVKTKFMNLLLKGQPTEIQDKILLMIESDAKFKKMNLKIDMFIDRVDALIQNFVQTITTTTLKLTTSWLPGVSFIGAILTSAINWTVLCVKTASRGYDMYKIHSEMQEIIVGQGGTKIDLTAEVGKLQNNIITSIAEVRVPTQMANMDAMKQGAMKQATASLDNVKAMAKDKAAANLDNVKAMAKDKVATSLDNVKAMAKDKVAANIDNVKAMAKDKVAANLDNVNKKFNEEATKQLKTNATELAATAMKQGANSLS